VNTGGRIIRDFEHQGDAASHAGQLNKGCSSGYYCVMIRD